VATNHKNSIWLLIDFLLLFRDSFDFPFPIFFAWLQGRWLGSRLRARKKHQFPLWKLKVSSILAPAVLTFSVWISIFLSVPFFEHLSHKNWAIEKGARSIPTLSGHQFPLRKLMSTQIWFPPTILLEKKNAQFLIKHTPKKIQRYGVLYLHSPNEGSFRKIPPLRILFIKVPTAGTDCPKYSHCHHNRIDTIEPKSDFSWRFCDRWHDPTFLAIPLCLGRE